MDFYKIREETSKDGSLKISPGFNVIRSKDLMVLGKSFYAIWDEANGLWSTDEYDVQRLVDEELLAYAEERKKTFDGPIKVHLMRNFSSNSWKDFRSFLKHLSDSAKQLDENLTFANTEVKKTDYVTRRLPYPLESGECPAWDELIGTLYSPEERAKIEWSIGSIIAGDAKFIQKFIVFYGKAGAGKSTIMNVIQKLFQGYYTTFDAKALTSNNGTFATEAFKTNPLAAIQHDGDLSKIEDNSKLNSIVSHEEIMINEKFKPQYMLRINAFLFMGTNKAVRITDAKSGIIRRLIDVHPSGELIEERRYHKLMAQIDFELGAIAAHCLDIYKSMGREYYSSYKPIEMMLQTDVFYNFIEASYDIFAEHDGVSLQQAYEMYKTFCTETLVEFKLPRHRFREELKNYFGNFNERAVVDGERMRSWYSGFIANKFTSTVKVDKEVEMFSLEETVSIFDGLFADRPAQYSKWSEQSQSEIPLDIWSNVKTTLSDIDTSQVHYVRVPENHIVIDFDLKDEDGNKSAEKNLAAAAGWPATYAEFSQGGAGVHLHYNWDGDVDTLSRVYAEGIEIKVFTGRSALRRRLSRCNSVPVATIRSGLPLREKKVLNFEGFKSEQGLRALIMKNLRKEVHSSTKPSVDFIYKILEDAYNSDLVYDVSDMRGRVLAFANNSTNSPEYCVKLVLGMKFASEEQASPEEQPTANSSDHRLSFIDTECFPNLFLISWKYEGENSPVVHMVNPKPKEIEPLLRLHFLGYNNRRYDNHMIYAAYMGYNNQQLFELSQKLISQNRTGFFREAYNLSYGDIYDILSVKQSLKRWQIDMGIRHKELGLPWDQPVPEELWPTVMDYCGNDVISEEKVLMSRLPDLAARKILAEVSGLTVNHTTPAHTAKIVFGDNRDPQTEFNYPDLSKEFPGYKYEWGKSTYKDIETGEGGYVHAKPGMYTNVAVLDIESMHPSTIRVLKLFGPYTKNFTDLLDARLAIKHGDYEKAGKLFGGALKKYLGSKEDAEELSYALKIVINTVYGLTAAKFDNPFRDIRNKDNVVAKRGALFMIDLAEAVEAKGFPVIHIKTDSIKIADATPEIIEFVNDFGKKYGYNFEHEVTYERFCLVNDAVYIAKNATAEHCALLYKGFVPKENQKHSGEWTATGAQFQHPYVFKTLFTKEPIEFRDLCETKQVTTALYLDFDAVDKPMHEADLKHPHFVGKAGSFCPVVEGEGGGLLLREKDGKFDSATGAKGYFWMEAEMVESLGKQKAIDMGYFNKLADAAIDNISKHGDFYWFVGEDREEGAA